MLKFLDVLLCVAALACMFAVGYKMMNEPVVSWQPVVVKPVTTKTDIPSPK